MTAIRGRRVITPDGERAATVLLRDGIITGLAGYPVRRPAPSPWPPTRCCCPAWSTATCTSTSPGAPSGRGSPPRPRRPPPAGSPRSSTCRSTASRRPSTVRRAAGQAGRRGRPARGRRRVLGRRGARQRRRPAARCTRPAWSGFKCFLLPSGVDEFAPLDPGPARRGDGRDRRLRRPADRPRRGPGGDRGGARRRTGRRYADFLASRPPEAEQRAIAALLEQTRRTGCRTHIVHLSSAAALPRFAAAKADGLPVTAETCPHYLTLRAEDVPDGATQFKCCPPIRDDANRDALWAGLRDGAIDSRRVRPLAVHGRGQAARHRRLRRGLGRHRVGAARAAGGVDRGRAARRRPGPGWRAGWPRPRPRWPAWPTAARSGPGCGPTCASSPRTSSSWSTRPRCGTATRSARTRAGPCAAWSGRPGWPGGRSGRRAGRAAGAMAGGTAAATAPAAGTGAGPAGGGAS